MNEEKIDRRIQRTRRLLQDALVSLILEKRYEMSAGKARVARDMVDMTAVQEKEAEKKALEQGALAEFLASQGIQATPATPASATPTVKEMGPER